MYFYWNYTEILYFCILAYPVVDKDNVNNAGSTKNAITSDSAARTVGFL